MNFVDLIELIVPREKWKEGQNLEKDTAHTPIVHLMVVVAIR